MGMLIDGVWRDDADHTIRNGRFTREPSELDSRIDRSIPALVASAPGRFVLIASYSCPWSHRVLLARALMQLDTMIPLFTAGGPRVEGYAIHGESLPPDLAPYRHLHQFYTRHDPDFSGRVTVPVLWDTHLGCIVSNDSATIMRSLDLVPASSGFQLAPPSLLDRIDSLNEKIYTGLANAVYRAGLAQTQRAYDEAVDDVFGTLGYLDEHLKNQRYLIDNIATEADWRLFATLVRFDYVYTSHFRCSRRRLTDYANLWGYARDLFSWQGVAGTVDHEQNIRGYVLNDGDNNPHGIVMATPEIDWRFPHGREMLGPARVWSANSGAVDIDPATLTLMSGDRPAIRQTRS